MSTTESTDNYLSLKNYICVKYGASKCKVWIGRSCFLIDKTYNKTSENFSSFCLVVKWAILSSTDWSDWIYSYFLIFLFRLYQTVDKSSILVASLKKPSEYSLYSPVSLEIKVEVYFLVNFKAGILSSGWSSNSLSKSISSEWLL